MEKSNGWELIAVKVFCPRDDWSEDQFNSIRGTWDEKEGSWYEYRHRCSHCKKENENLTAYCPHCGKKMTYVQKVSTIPFEETSST